MIRVMTLDIGTAAAHSTKPIDQTLGSLAKEVVDVLCCQSVRRSLNNDRDSLLVHLERAGLRYSCFASNRQASSGQRQPQAGDLSGLAIMTGARIWMLNSGSFPLPGMDGQGEWIAQFAHIRQGLSSLLVVNAQAAPDRKNQVAQMRTAFASPLLHEQYGAVVLCSGEQMALTESDWLSVTARSRFMPYHGPSNLGNDGAATLVFAARGQEFTVSATPYDPLPVTEGNRQVVLPIPRYNPAVAVEITRLAAKQRVLLPLSFREQWLGSKENFRAFAY